MAVFHLKVFIVPFNSLNGADLFVTASPHGFEIGSIAAVSAVL